ncbi:MAG: hypothetical protein ABFD92_14930 [Planctomycetaceae bacterium]|nr:hypothetical protein [Planctomycetaceae bacterium]
MAEAKTDDEDEDDDEDDPPTMAYSTLFALNNANNFLDSSCVSIELSSQLLNGCDALFRRARQPVRQVSGGLRLVSDIVFGDHPLDHDVYYRRKRGRSERTNRQPSPLCHGFILSQNRLHFAA